MHNLPMYLRPNEVETKIGISSKTLRDLKDTVLIKGIHYFIPHGLTHPLWNRDALLAWINGDTQDNVSALVDEILKNK